ncbi:AraC family transcriptional regulator [Aeoliella mucimassa]|uniref:Xylose operon regulatory protein n=1 Tax=Aeoliella mucimassa TaxID=2527972 RepID=A0A518AQJ7_9BACT|nr:DNA-binding transcriptional regulator [Aeoliella mucimassa]QDU56987.1 Xylose operon regulatory protein [Aeoliella mucimassa]
MPADSTLQRPVFRVGLILQTGQEFMRGITRGVYRFLRVNRHWRIQGEGQYPLLQWEEVANWKGDGLIAVINSQEHLKILLNAGVPVVNAGSRIIDHRFATVACDNLAIGSLAAEHLMQCGLKQFLFVGELRWHSEQQRSEAFMKAVTEAGHHCQLLKIAVHEVVAADSSGHYRPDLKAIANALQKAKKPLGVCTPNSALSRLVAEVALESGFEVPDEIAVMGVNDDPLICESTVPHLSAVVQPAERIGYEAALRLDAAMSGRPVESMVTFFPPVGVAVRQSTDVLAVDDEDVREALKYIRENAHLPIEVSDISEHIAISRRTLETRFRTMVGRTPALELRRVRLELAKKLLAETTDSITSVVFACGFNSRQVFSSLFRKEVGVTPSEYRHQFQMDVLPGPQ